MAYQDITTVNMSEGITSIWSYIDVVTFNWFPTLILFSIWIITLIFYYKSREEIPESFAVAGFVAFIVGLLFWLGDFITDPTFTITIIVAIISAVFLFFDKK